MKPKKPKVKKVVVKRGEVAHVHVEDALPVIAHHADKGIVEVVAVPKEEVEKQHGAVWRFFFGGND